MANFVTMDFNLWPRRLQCLQNAVGMTDMFQAKSFFLFTI